MAKGKNPPGKKTAPKKSSSKRGTTTKEQVVRIIVEVIVKDQRSGSDKALLEAPALAKPKIGYQFTRNQLTVVSLTIENKTVQNPSDSGIIELDYIPMDGMISYSAYALGQGTGTLQLTYNGKNLLNPPEEFVVNNGQGFIRGTAQIA